MLVPRPIKSRNGGIGGGGQKNAIKAMKRSKLRPVSKRQRARNKGLAEKKMLIFEKQVEFYGTTRCEAGAQGYKPGCFGELVLDHVEGRNNTNADRFGNLQILCTAHNGMKGSRRGKDFRDGRMITAMQELDRKGNL